MALKIRIGYFLEDRGHEILLRALVSRIAAVKGLKPREWIDDVRSATGGKSIQAYRRFLSDISKMVAPFPFDLLIVASDGNCKGYTERKNQLLQYAEKARIVQLDRIILAVPDPHIERWYLDDPLGFVKAIGKGKGTPPLIPPYKCKRGLYKKAMRDAIVASDVTTQFGGYEYGGKIVEEMDMYEATKADSSLRHFVDDLSDALTRITSIR